MEGSPVPLQTCTPIAPQPLPSKKQSKPTAFHPKLPEMSPNRAAQTGTSCLKSPALRNSAPGGEFGFDEDVESLWGSQISPTVAPLAAQPHVPVPPPWGGSGLLGGQEHPWHGRARGLLSRAGGCGARPAPRAMFFIPLWVGFSSAGCWAPFRSSCSFILHFKGSGGRRFQRHCHFERAKKRGDRHHRHLPGPRAQGLRARVVAEPTGTRPPPLCPAVSHPTASRGIQQQLVYF